MAAGNHLVDSMEDRPERARHKSGGVDSASRFCLDEPTATLDTYDSQETPRARTMAILAWRREAHLLDRTTGMYQHYIPDIITQRETSVSRLCQIFSMTDGSSREAGDTDGALCLVGAIVFRVKVP